MADAVDGGSPGSGMPAYMYEQLREMVFGDDPDAVRDVGEWLRGRGRLIAEFAATLHRELSMIDELYSSAEGAPALKAQLYQAVVGLQELGNRLIHNGHVINSAGDAIETAQSQVDAAYPKVKPGGAVFRGLNPQTDPPSQKARPYVESLNTYLYNLTDALALLADEDRPYETPEPPPSNDPSKAPMSLGGSSPVGSGPAMPGLSGVRQGGAQPGPSLPRGSAPGSHPSPGGSMPTTPGRGAIPPGVVGSPASKGRAGTTPTVGGAGRRISMPGSRSGDLLGRMRPPTGEVAVGSESGIGEPASETYSPEGRPPGDTGGPGRYGAAPPGGEPSPASGVPPSIHEHRGQSRRGKKKPGYERGESDTFVDGRFANVTGGELRAPSRERPVDAGPGVIGNQKRKPADAPGQSPWELPQSAPAPEGLPEEFQEGTFRGKGGVQFEVRRRVGGA
ncbi:MAG TPA: hypothetical protein VGK54_13795 [Chloroflexota bacterium]|jgi:hypothetical protein